MFLNLYFLLEIFIFFGLNLDHHDRKNQLVHVRNVRLLFAAIGKRRWLKNDWRLVTLKVGEWFLFLDKRVADWPLMDTPMKTFAILLVYVILLRLIRQTMANKKPFELKWVLIIYNAIQVVGSFYIFLEVNILLQFYLLIKNIIQHLIA